MTPVLNQWDQMMDTAQVKAKRAGALWLNQWGSPSPGQRAALMLHGFTGDGLDYCWLSAHLSSRYTLAPDLIGHGKSPAPATLKDYTMSACVDQLEAMLDEVHPEPVHLLGYSMGGRAALSLALRAPQRFCSLTLIGATAGLARDDERVARISQDELLASSIERDGVADFMMRWRQVPILLTQRQIEPTVLASMDARRLMASPQGLAMSLRGMGTGAMASSWERLGQLELPCALVTGAQDLKFDALAVQLQALLSNSMRIIIEGAGHTCHLERPKHLAPALEAFWRRHE